MKRYSLLVAACLCLVGGQAFGGISYSAIAPAGDGHQAYAASVDFSVASPGVLQVILTNTSTADTLVPIDVLTGVFFTLNGGAVTLTPESALLNGSSTVLYAPSQPAGGNVGGEWAYLGGLSGAPHGADAGISSTGLGLFGDGNFNGPNLAPPDALDGLQYGILSAGDNIATGNAAILDGGASGAPGTAGGLIKNSVVFTLSGLGGLTLDDLTFTKVSFQYGTALKEPNIEGLPDGDPNIDGVGVPEPGSLLVWGLLGAAGIFYHRRRSAV